MIIVIMTWLLVSTAVQATAGLTIRRWILCLGCFYTWYLQRYSQGALLDFDRCWSVWMFTHVTDSIHCAWSSRLSTTTCDVTSQDASLRGTAQWAVPVKKERYQRCYWQGRLDAVLFMWCGTTTLVRRNRETEVQQGSDTVGFNVKSCWWIATS